MLSITEEERAIFDEKKKFSIKANMDDASLLGDLYDDLLALVGRPANEEHAKILNIIYKRAMRVIEETCKNKGGYDYNRNIEAVLAEALQKQNGEFQKYLNDITDGNPQESIISDFDFLIFLDKEKLTQYIAKKEAECKDIYDLKEFYNLMSKTAIDVHSTVKEALWDLDVILPALDLAIPGEQNSNYSDEWVVGDTDDLLENDEQTNEQVNDSEESSDWILEDYDSSEEIDSWDDLVEEITETEEDKSTEITPEKFKKFAEMLELFPRIGEIQQNLSDEMSKMFELIRQRTLEDFKSNPIFVSDLEVIMKHSKEESQYHYHGTQDLKSAAQILKQGLLMTRGLDSTSYSEFTMDELLLYERGLGGEIGSSGIVIIDQPIVDGKRTEIVEELKVNHGYSFVPSGLQGLNNKPENIVQAQYIVGYVDKINRKVVLNPLYYGYKKKLEEMEAKRKTITKKTELDGVDILTAGSSAEVDRCDEMDMVLGTITNELTIDDKNQEIND